MKYLQNEVDDLIKAAEYLSKKSKLSVKDSLPIIIKIESNCEQKKLVRTLNEIKSALNLSGTPSISESILMGLDKIANTIEVKE